MQPSSRSQTSSASAVARRWPLGWMGSTGELSGQSGSWIVEVYVMRATVAGQGGTVARASRVKDGGRLKPPSSRLQTASASAAGARREPLGWTASASELLAGSSSWTVEVYVMCATVADQGGTVR